MLSALIAALEGAPGRRRGSVLVAPNDVQVSFADTGAQGAWESLGKMPTSTFNSSLRGLLAPNGGGHGGGERTPRDEVSLQGDASSGYADTNIVFAVLTGKEHHEDRAEAVKATWCSEINACIFFSDTPSESLPTVSISFEGLPVGLSKYNRAQLRYVPVLNYMRELLVGGHDDTFRNCKWMVIVDDDTFVLYHNLKQFLSTLNHDNPIYTGDVVPDNWMPVSKDGMGNDLGVSSNTLFINGGGGSVFSRAALQRMNTEHCVNNSMPGQAWWRWQSDWMIGACAADAGIPPLRQNQGRFNQFVCSDEGVQFCDGREYDFFEQPSTLHPIRVPSQMHYLYQYYGNSTYSPVPHVRMKRVAKRQNAIGQGWAASSGIELS